MKNRKLKSLFGVLFALAMALSVGTALASARFNKPAEIVLADGEESEEPTETSSNDEEDVSSNPETPTSSEEETPATSEEPAESSEGEESASDSEYIEIEVEPKDIFQILGNTFRDAIKDLIEHIKRWLKLK